MPSSHILITSLVLLPFTRSFTIKPPRLDSWMGDLQPILGNLTIMDLALPGTHDTLTFDLSTTVADDANDLPAWAAWFLHTFHSLGGAVIGEFIRENAKTQEINVTQQLQAGVRFLDLRTIYTSPPEKAVGSKDWYSLHMVESNKKSMSYFQSIAEFLRDHPKEVVVMMLTRHGCEDCTGDKQYPGASDIEKQTFWKQIKQAFSNAGVGFVPGSGDNYTSVNSTTLNELVRTNKRALLYAGDYANFTGNDPLAWDGAFVYNGGAGEDVPNLPKSYEEWDKFYRANEEQRAGLKRQNKFFLMSLAGSPPGAVTQYAAEIYAAGIIGLHPKDLVEKCSKAINIPNLTDWCPGTLNEFERLRNFYSQIFLDRLVQAEYEGVYSPPGAIYLDVVGAAGEIRTDSVASNKHGCSYVDTLLLWNVRRACGGGSTLCNSTDAALVQRRSDNKCEKWDDPSTGRHATWPKESTL